MTTTSHFFQLCLWLWLLCATIEAVDHAKTKGAEFLRPKYPAWRSYVNRTHYHKDGDPTKLYESDVDACDSFYVSPLFSSGMVLQRAPQQAVIFGYGSPNGSVVVTLTNASDSSDSQTFETTISAASSTDAALGLGECSWHVVLPAMPATLSSDSPYDISIQCTEGCDNWSANETIVISQVQFGDVWVCSGQSNMGLPVQNTYSWYNSSINSTTEQYNIQVIRISNTMSLTPLDSRSYIGGTDKWYHGNYANLTKMEFSAICYYYARNLVDFWTDNNLDVIPIGLVESQWGGTIIEGWMSQEDQYPCDYRICENYVGATTYGIYYAGNACNSSKTTSVNDQPASAHNGMILPLTNLTVKGALWYQGENNGANPGSWLKNQGYACMLPRLINNWRRDWAQNNFATNGLDANNGKIGVGVGADGAQSRVKDGMFASPDMPFGVVSLHPWCGEEAANCYPVRNYSELSDHVQPTYYNLAWLRWAQVGSMGRSPNWIMRNTFVAMAYDLGDTGAPPPPEPYEGPLHPRNKFTLGKRIALGSIAIAYGNDTVSYTGPVLSFCDVDYDALTLNLQFDAELLRGENVIAKHSEGFEVQTNGSLGGWYQTNISSVASSGNDIMLDLSPVLGSNDADDSPVYDKIIGVRYEWRDLPCCNTTNWSPKRGDLPCPEASCAVYTENSDLPLIPFIYSINQKGECVMSVQYEN